jgi:hypothetical protein
MELSELSDTAVGAENEKKSGRGEEGEAAREGGSNGESVGERSMACRWRENFVVVKRREGVRTGRAVVIPRRQQPDTGRPTGKGRDKMKIRRCREESREVSPTRRRPTTRNQSSRRRWSQERRVRERGRGQEKKILGIISWWSGWEEILGVVFARWISLAFLPFDSGRLIYCPLVDYSLF